MNLQHRHQGCPAALDLQTHCIFLARNGAMRSYAKTAAFFRNAGQTPTFADGHMLALHHASGPSDMHYPTWEMHPEGDELLILASGSLLVELREEKTERTATLSPQAALIVPTGVWHRVIVHEPSVLIAITPRHNTIHEKG